jgi:uncharacterized membrane protein YjdF
MSNALIIAVCTLLVIAYLFDRSASRTRIPSVILLLSLGWGLQQLIGLLPFELPDLQPVLPVMGTIGLILIVLEGSLELHLNKEKIPLVRRAVLIALLPLVTGALLAAAWMYHSQGTSFKNSLAAAIPLFVISSAIAIPSARNLNPEEKEFVTYESSISDIIGVILFNFIVYNEVIDAGAIGSFIGNMLVILIISAVSTIFLAWFMARNEHHVRFIPIIICIILIYAAAKVWHLPSLLFILIFGLFLANLQPLRNRSWFNKFPVDALIPEVHKFHELGIEMAFLVRSLFFILFGFLMSTDEILNQEALPVSLSITGLIIALRILFLLFFGKKLNPLVFLAPRGLITILLFLSIPESQQIPFINKSVVIQVILFSALFMMFGLIRYKTPAHEN